LTIPLFPLPNVVLFPNVFLPLHIFEPRYRQMTADALAGDRIIGMVMLRAGYQADYEGAPPIYATGCSGLITHHEQLEDGRYNLVLRGLAKFTVSNEHTPPPGRLYRSATIAPLEDSLRDGERDALRKDRRRLQDLLVPVLQDRLEAAMPAAMPDEELINALAQYLEFDPMERLALLECQGALARCRSMIDLLEMRRMGSGLGDPGSGKIH